MVSGVTDMGRIINYLWVQGIILNAGIEYEPIHSQTISKAFGDSTQSIDDFLEEAAFRSRWNVLSENCKHSDIEFVGMEGDFDEQIAFYNCSRCQIYIEKPLTDEQKEIWQKKYVDLKPIF